MANVSDTVPSALQPEVDAALNWYNKSQSDSFEVTGIIDADTSLAEAGTRELRLVLCGGDTCQQQTFFVDSDFNVSLSAVDTAQQNQGEDELDPPPGARRDWLARTLNQHKFVVLVFYRGFW